MLKTIFKPTQASKYNNLFWQNGYLFLPNYFSIKEAAKIKKIADELDNFPEEKGKWMIYYEKDNNSIKKKARIENIINYHSELEAFVQEKLTPTLEAIYQKPMCLFKDKMNWKKPYGKGFAAHQDQPAWNDFPPSRFVTVAIFADRSTKQNGCLEFSPGRHQEGILGSQENNAGVLSKEVESELTWNALETTGQDMLIFDSFAPHRSKSNKTDTNRRIFYFTYNILEEGIYYDDYITKKREIFPPDIERDENKIYNSKTSKYNLGNPIE